MQGASGQPNAGHPSGPWPNPAAHIESTQYFGQAVDNCECLAGNNEYDYE
jgi:hypothetical protein